MKKTILLLLVFSAACKSHKKEDDKNFTAQRISQAASIQVNGEIENVFPLFGAFDERKWAEGWDPTLVYPATEVMEEGTTFKTMREGHGYGESENEFLWRVIRYEPKDYFIQYLVSTPNRYWTITVRCVSAGYNISKADITYTYTGLNNLGNEINAAALKKMYAQNLKDWESSINFFLKTGRMKKEGL